MISPGSFRGVKTAERVPITRRAAPERAARQDTEGSVDLIWINGPNFLAMKEASLLFGPFVDRLPNARLIDAEGKPATVTDFTVPVDGGMPKQLPVPNAAKAAYSPDGAKIAYVADRGAGRHEEIADLRRRLRHDQRQRTKDQDAQRDPPGA